MKYTFADVKNEKIKSFHVRASSIKEKINLNKKLMVFMIHGSTLYYWVDGKNKIEQIDTGTTSFKYFSDEKLFYRTTENVYVDNKVYKHSIIKMISI